MKYDFGGYATKNDIECSDGRIIRAHAFAEQDGEQVPLVWQHGHDSVDNVLGHAVLQDTEDGVRCLCTFNDTKSGNVARELVKCGDIDSLSIHAGELIQHGKDVVKGKIREVSLVLAGANPGARIDDLSFCHDANGNNVVDEALIYSGAELFGEGNYQNDVSHSEDDDADVDFFQIYQNMNDDQKGLVDALMSQIELEEADSSVDDNIGEGSEGDDIEHSAAQEVEFMKTNVFEGRQAKKPAFRQSILTHDAFQEVMKNAEKCGSFNTAFHDFLDRSADELMHDAVGSIVNPGLSTGAMVDGTALTGAPTAQTPGQNYASPFKVTAVSDLPESYGGIGGWHGNSVDANDGYYPGGDPTADSISVLFPEVRDLWNAPQKITREMSWVSVVLGGVTKVPFSKIKTKYANLTMDEARARGYIKGNKKLPEKFNMLRRETDATTVYIKQQIDRDDIIDITDFDVVAWIRSEMRELLNEEIARAILIGDGRPAGHPDKIDERRIIPVWKDDDMFVVREAVNETKWAGAAATSKTKCDALIEAMIKARKYYKGSGQPIMFTFPGVMAELLLAQDLNGRYIFESEAAIASKLRVQKIVECELLEDPDEAGHGVSWEVEDEESGDTTTHELIALALNLKDYATGTNKGGNIASFDDFDIDFNQFKYLMETRLSGMMTKYKGAIAIELVTTEEAEDDTGSGSGAGGQSEGGAAG